MADWASLGLCRVEDITGAEFMPTRENDPRIEKAKAICRRCPVRAPCLQEGLEPLEGNGRLPAGVWGGNTEAERRRIKRLLGGKTLAEAREEFQSASGQTN